MQGYDILMIGVLAFATLRGYLKGLAWQVSSIASIVVSYVVAFKLRERIAPLIDIPDPWRNLVAMLIVFTACSLAIWFLFQNVRGAIEKAKLKDFDKQLGAVFGAVRGAAWCTVITLFAISMLQPQMSQEIVNSRSGGYIARILASSKAIIPPQVQEVIQPYLQKAEERLQERSPDAAQPGSLLKEAGEMFPGGDDDPLKQFSDSDSDSGLSWQQ